MGTAKSRLSVFDKSFKEEKDYWQRVSEAIGHALEAAPEDV